MRFTDLLKPANVVVPLAAPDKAGAIRELVDTLARNGELTDSARVLEAVMEREQTRSTGIGYGVAIPHGKTVGTDGLCVAFGKAATPIDFDAMDRKPVSFLWLLISPPDKTGLHISMLSKISKLMRPDEVRAALLKAQSPGDVLAIVAAHEPPA